MNWFSLLSFTKEILIVVFAYVFYFIVRGSVTERVGEAMLRALDVINLEERLGLYWELELQAWGVSHGFIAQCFNQIYIWGNLPFLAIVAVWFYVCYRERYILYRNAVLISGAIALILFVTMPTAPPRYIWWAGFKDTVALQASGYYDIQADAFVNRFAAVPSMHFGWVLLLGIAIVSTVDSLPLKLIGLVMPLLMFLSIVVTGNHFIFDAIAGGVVSLAGLILAMLLERQGGRLYKRLRTVRILAFSKNVD